MIKRKNYRKGKEFAVVTEEVRNMADQFSSSTQKTAKLIIKKENSIIVIKKKMRHTKKLLQHSYLYCHSLDMASIRNTPVCQSEPTFLIFLYVQLKAVYQRHPDDRN